MHNSAEASQTIMSEAVGHPARQGQTIDFAIAYRALLDNIQAGCALLEVVYDGQGGADDLKFSEVNEAYAKVQRLQVETPLVGRLVSDVFQAIGPNFDWRRNCLEVALYGAPARFVLTAEDGDQWYDVALYQASPGFCAVAIQGARDKYLALEVQTEARYRTLFDHMQMGLMLHQVVRDEGGKPVDLRYLDVNDECCRMFKFKREDRIGKRLLEIMPSLPQIIPQWDQLLSVAETGNPLKFEVYLDHINSWLLAFAYSPAPDKIAIINGGSNATRDAVAALSNSEKRYRALFDHMQISFALLDVVPDHDGTPTDLLFVDVNAEFCRIFKVPRYLCIGKTLSALVSSLRHNAEIWGRLLAIANGGPSLTFEDHIDTPLLDIWVEVVAYSPMEGQIAVLIKDISDQKWTLQALTHSEQHYRSLFDHMEMGFGLFQVVRDDDGRPIDLTFTEINDEYCRLLHTTREDRLGRRLTEIIPDIRAEIEPWDDLLAVGDTAQAVVFERYIAHRDIWTRTVAYCPAPGQCALLVQDTTEAHRMQAVLAEQHERLQVTFQSIGDAVITTTAGGLVDYLNPVAERMTGWPVAEAVGRPLGDVFNIVNENTGKPTLSPVEICLIEERIVGLANHTVLISRDGKHYAIEDSAAPIRTHDGTILGVVLVFHDVTEQRQIADEMTHRATHDSLTGIINRSEFEHRLQLALQSAREGGAVHTVLYIDLDRFKLVNDACGHAAGDQLLRQVADTLQACVRASDTLARLGGDEFGVILDYCGHDRAMQIGQQICDRVDELRFIHDEQRFRIGASIGLIPLDRRWHSTAAILQAADTACYAAKSAGRNRVYATQYDDTTVAAHRSEVQWATRIEEALEEGLFCLYWQQIFHLDSLPAAGDGLHGEVLIRLRDRAGGIIPPGAFLHAAERFYMATRIDQWVVATVVAWMAEHAAEIARIDTISVNLSGQSIGDLAFHRYILDLIETIPFDRAKLCLEVTETTAISNLADARLFLEAVRGQGIRCALDDFGSGMSSFGYLKRLPIDFLKIDGQFIRNLTTDPIDQATVRCICEIAKVMGKRTIAEFVDSVEAEALLREIGIDFTQGYLRHRPEPLDLMLKAGR